ncbi:MAG: hypothetical protein AB7N76_15835 [Planctomycetota bacterium]
MEVFEKLGDFMGQLMLLGFVFGVPVIGIPAFVLGFLLGRRTAGRSGEPPAKP